MRSGPVNSGRREAERIAVELPVEMEKGQGVTRDVSASGVFFETALIFSLGDVIDFSLVLEHADSAGPLRVQCHGRVVRVEQCGGKAGVAVAVTSHVLDPSASRMID